MAFLTAPDFRGENFFAHSQAKANGVRAKTTAAAAKRVKKK
jgi:hypothetical protein